MDVIEKLLEVAQTLYSLCQTMQENKEECGRLGNHVASMQAVLRGLQKQQDPRRQTQDLDKRLVELGACFTDAEKLVNKYGNKSGFEKFFKAKAMENDFQGVFVRLEDLRRLLSLSLQVEQRGQVQSVHDTVDRAENKIDALHEKMDKLIMQDKEGKDKKGKEPAGPSPSAGPGTPSPAASSQDAVVVLGEIRSRFVEKAGLSLLKQLLDELRTERVLNEEEAESVLEEQSGRADRARCLIDMVRKKGRRASERMIAHLREKDPSLAETLGLI